MVGNPVSSVQAPVGTVGDPNALSAEIGALSIERGYEEDPLDTSGSVDKKSSEINDSTNVSIGSTNSNYAPDAQEESTVEEGAGTYGGDEAQANMSDLDNWNGDPSNSPSDPPARPRWTARR